MTGRLRALTKGEVRLASPPITNLQSSYAWLSSMAGEEEQQGTEAATRTGVRCAVLRK